MRRALELAERGWGQTAPNPMVGAVLVRDTELVGEGWHARYGAPHAEVNAVAAAGERARGARLYVTLEPCAHFGRTPPCTAAIVAAGIAEVIAGTADPTAAGGGAGILQAAGIPVRIGCEEDEAREQNAAFHYSARADRPWVTLKLALSADDAIAAPADAAGARPRLWLTGEASRREVHRMRANSDAVAVGIGTLLADDPKLTVRHSPQPRVAPARVVFDRRARTPLASYVVRSAGEVATIVVTADDSTPAADALRAHGVDVLAAPDAATALRVLRARGIRSLLVEGGAGLAGALLDADCVDRLVTIRSDRVLGAGALDAFACVESKDAILGRLRPRARRNLGADVLSVFDVAGHDV
jgi:diaminohydroxyphosphoribosylaminopyrimidine deaminase / 5-amino-6-(5-phosphoribosylamino)uracil reductase